ncbi:MAG: type III-B CRISPR module RAMP protein Cmr1 [Ignavibacteria bacterium]
MKTYKFECRVISPLFMAGANDQEPEIRPASIKGVLRWWFRTLYGAELYSKFSEHTKVIGELQKKEFEIFGSTSGKSSFILNISKVRIEKDVFDKNVLSAYAGYGLDGTRNKLPRKYIKSAGTFELNIVFLKDNEEKEKYVLASLSLLSAFGNMGAKGNRGFGSIKLNPSEKYSYFENTPAEPEIRKYHEKLLAEIYRDFGIKKPEVYPKFPVISPAYFTFRYYSADALNNVNNVITKFGKELRRFRENRQEKGSRPNTFHSYAYHAVKPQDTDIADDNIFGLPHNFAFSDRSKAEVKIKAGGDEKKYERRASPVKFKVSEHNGKIYPGLVIFESHFLPDNAKIFAVHNGKKNVLKTPEFSRAEEFMNHLSGVFR